MFILFDPSLFDVEKNKRYIEGIDITFVEFKNLHRKAWEEIFNYRLIIG